MVVTILICFIQILVHFSFQSLGMCAFLSLEHKQYENKCIHLELFCVNILTFSNIPGYRDSAWFLFSRLQLYLVSQPCHGWSNPSMALSGFTKIPNLLPAFLSIYLYALNYNNTVLLLFSIQWFHPSLWISKKVISISIWPPRSTFMEFDGDYCGW
jgi:hypothetical protein